MFSLINCPIKPSRTLAVLYAGVHLLASFFVLSLDAELFVRLILLSLIALIFFYYLSTHLLLNSADAVTALTWQADDKRLQLLLGGVEWVTVVQARQKVVTPIFVYMLVDVEGRWLNIPVIVFWDSCSATNFRRLKVLVAFASLNAEVSAN